MKKLDDMTSTELLDEALRHLDRHLGDSDPIAGPESDEEFAEEYPGVWAHRLLLELRDRLT